MTQTFNPWNFTPTASPSGSTTPSSTGTPSGATQPGPNPTPEDLAAYQTWLASPEGQAWLVAHPSTTKNVEVSPGVYIPMTVQSADPFAYWQTNIRINPETGFPGPTPELGVLNAFQTIKTELEDWGLGGLTSWAWGLYVKGFDEDYIISQLHTTDIFKQMFPEYAARVAAGHTAMSPAEILQARDDLRSVTKGVFGIDLTADEVARLITNNRSANEWQHDLGVFKTVQNLGGEIQDLFQQEYGHTLSDTDLHDFFDPTKNTAEIDKAFETAVFRGYLRNLGVQNGVITEDRVAQLRARGFDVPTVMESYKKIAQSLPSIERLAAIDNGISGDKTNPFDSLGEAFSNFALLDPKAQSDILRLFANETARFAPTGGIAGGGVGFLSRFERK